jgi:hypothetical protein
MTSQPFQGPVHGHDAGGNAGAIQQLLEGRVGLLLQQRRQSRQGGRIESDEPPPASWAGREAPAFAPTL